MIDYIEHMYVVVKVSPARWQVAESWSVGGEVTYKGSIQKHFRVVGPRFASWELAHEHAGHLDSAQRQALEVIGGRSRERSRTRST